MAKYKTVCPNKFIKCLMFHKFHSSFDYSLFYHFIHQVSNLNIVEILWKALSFGAFIILKIFFDSFSWNVFYLQAIIIGSCDRHYDPRLDSEEVGNINR